MRISLLHNDVILGSHSGDEDDPEKKMQGKLSDAIMRVHQANHPLEPHQRQTRHSC